MRFTPFYDIVNGTMFELKTLEKRFVSTYLHKKRMRNDLPITFFLSTSSSMNMQMIHFCTYKSLIMIMRHSNNKFIFVRVSSSVLVECSRTIDCYKILIAKLSSQVNTWWNCHFFIIHLAFLLTKIWEKSFITFYLVETIRIITFVFSLMCFFLSKYVDNFTITRMHAFIKRMKKNKKK